MIYFKLKTFAKAKILFCVLIFLSLNTFGQNNSYSDLNMEIEDIILKKDSVQLEQILKENNLNINSVIYNVTPLFLACHKPDSLFINWMLKKGASPNVISRYGTVGNWILEKKNYTGIFNMLLDYGFDPNIESMAYWQNKKETHPEEIPDWLNKAFQKIKENNLKTEHLPYFAYTDPSDDLILAISIVRDSTLTLTKRLLDYKLDVNMIDKKGVTPIFYAVHFKNTEAIQLFIKNGANVNHILAPPVSSMYENSPIFNNKITPLIMCMQEIEQDPKLLNKKETMSILKILLKAGADIHHQTAQEKISASDIANKLNNKEINKLFKKYGK